MKRPRLPIGNTDDRLYSHTSQAGLFSTVAVIKNNKSNNINVEKPMSQT